MTARLPDPRRLARRLRLVVLAAGAALIWWGMRDLRFVTISREDDSTPSVRPGARALVALLDEEPLERGGLYLFDPTGSADEIADLRLARLHGLPGDTVACTPRPAVAGGRSERSDVVIGELTLVMPSEIAALLPAEVPAGSVLLFTDNPACRHLDSRALGPLPIERLKLRLLGSLGGLPR